MKDKIVKSLQNKIHYDESDIPELKFKNFIA